MSVAIKYAPIAVYQPLEWQVAPLYDTSPVMLLTGSAGGGKSRVAAEKLHAFCKAYPGAMAIMLRKKRQSMTNSTVLFMDRTIIGRDPTVTHFSSKLRFEYDNGSVLAYGGMADEEQMEQIRSIGQEGGVDIAWMEEANRFFETDFNELTARMRGRAAPWTQIILSTNPDHPLHWIRRRLILGGEASVYYSRADQNTYNPSSYKSTLARLTGHVGSRLRDGQWVKAEGTVYDTFNDSLHVVEPFPIPPDWRRIRVIDFGYSNPFVCLWIAIDPDDVMYVYREIYMTHRTVNVHAKTILELSYAEEIEATVCDHDAEDRATLEENGIDTIPAMKDVSRGIQSVKDRLDDHDKVRVKIFRNCIHEIDDKLNEAKKPISILDEFPSYAWPTSTDGRPIKEVPMKVNDHGMDAIRYGVMYVDNYAAGMDYA